PGYARQPTGTSTEKGPESRVLALARLAEVFGCSNPSGPEYPCPTPPYGQLPSHLYKRRGRSLQNERGLGTNVRRARPSSTKMHRSEFWRSSARGKRPRISR